MKKLIGICIIGIIIAIFSQESTRPAFHQGNISKNSKKMQAEEQVKKIEFVADSSLTIEDFEKIFFNKSDIEIREAIKKNNLIARKMHFVDLANSNQMDAATRIEFLKYIHLNGALHKILLERQLEEIEGLNI